MNTSDKQHIMASEAQRLIGVSLAKIAQSRVSRGGVSLHKNLLVATVLQKARYVFMEEAYNIVHGHYPHQQSRQIAVMQRHHQQQQQQQQQQHQLQIHYHQQQQERAKYASNHQQQQQQPHQPQYHHQTHSHRESSAAAKSSLTKQLNQHQTNQQSQAVSLYRHYLRLGHESDNEVFERAEDSSTLSTVNSTFNNDKENISPPETLSSTESTAAPDQLTYLDLDSHNKLSRVSPPNENSLKRRRVISELETKEAVLSILPKRSRADVDDHDDEDSVFIDEISDRCEAHTSSLPLSSPATTTTNTTSTALQPNIIEPMDTNTVAYDEETATDLSAYAEPMEIDRISSLVSIFNFGSISRSAPNVSDTCSTQANHLQPDDGIGNASTGGIHHQHSMVAMSV